MTPQARLDVSFGALPLLTALCHKPMNRIELRRQLQTSASSVTKYLGELIDHGLIVERLDRKFQVIVALKYEARPEIRGKVVTAEPTPEAIVYEPEAPSEPVLPVPAPPAPVLAPVVSQLPPRAANGRYEHMPVAPAARRISQTMNVPAYLPNRGEVQVVQQVGECEGCQVTTPFRWGKHVLCPKCGRKELEG
jgi:hypothetical protein